MSEDHNDTDHQNLADAPETALTNADMVKFHGIQHGRGDRHLDRAFLEKLSAMGYIEPDDSKSLTRSWKETPEGTTVLTKWLSAQAEV